MGSGVKRYSAGITQSQARITGEIIKKLLTTKEQSSYERRDEFRLYYSYTKNTLPAVKPKLSFVFWLKDLKLRTNIQERIGYHESFSNVLHGCLILRSVSIDNNAAYEFIPLRIC